VKTLVVAELYPWPALDGYRRRLDHVVAGLASVGDVDVLAPLRAGDTAPAAPPLPNVTGATAPTAPDQGPRSWVGDWLRSPVPRRLLGVDWSGPRAELGARDLSQYDLVWCSHVDTWWAVKDLVGGLPVVVDFDNLEHLALRLRRRIPPRNAPGAGVKEVASTLARWTTSRAFDLVDERRWDRLQRDCAAQVARVVVCSELDAERSGVPNVAVVPNGAVAPAGVDPDRTSLRGDHPVLNFVGALDYEPGGLLCAGAQLVPGVELVGDLVGLWDAVEEADVVVTGEGLLDTESFDGKVVGGVAALALDLGVPTVAVVGAVDGDGLDDVLPAGLRVVSLTEEFGSERSLGDVAGCLRDVAATLV